jgi:hypothetical protein
MFVPDAAIKSSAAPFSATSARRSWIWTDFIDGVIAWICDLLINKQGLTPFPIMKADVQNIWVLAGAQPLPIGEPAPPSAEAGMVLTDNHAPVEFLIALDVRREAGAGEYPR